MMFSIYFSLVIKAILEFIFYVIHCNLAFNTIHYKTYVIIDKYILFAIVKFKIYMWYYERYYKYFMNLEQNKIYIMSCPKNIINEYMNYNLSLI